MITNDVIWDNDAKKLLAKANEMLGFLKGKYARDLKTDALKLLYMIDFIV